MPALADLEAAVRDAILGIDDEAAAVHVAAQASLGIDQDFQLTLEIRRLLHEGLLIDLAVAGP